VAEKEQADVIGLGVRNTKSIMLATHFRVTVAHNVISYATCPVLTVRARAAYLRGLEHIYAPVAGRSSSVLRPTEIAADCSVEVIRKRNQPAEQIRKERLADGSLWRRTTAVLNGEC
jgi:hypothetical protein